MTGPHLRAGRQAVAPVSPIHAIHAPHAALLIDFDNVTMGIRSDLTKELKALLNSDIIRGKVTVQRAYADWRRYPQYVMPLTERSIDMIWATAVGSTKKNATDIRLAIDAIELVFTRPEIGTFIILSGDSDFSSLVLKLKEYGKYVVGIGIRESASDLLIQNCDEYYSYSELAGLNKETDAPGVQRDPWELVRDAIALMVKNGDVLRSDRLKQVMQQIDPNFDERNAGFSRFSKFVTEAATRGLVSIAKLDNGQFEVGPGASGGRPEAAAAPSPRDRNGDDGGRRGGRRGRDRDRGRRGGRPTEEAAAPAPAAAAPAPAKEKRPEIERPTHLTLGAAFALMTRALGELPTPVQDDALRARMAAIHGREDPLLERERFHRLLRQANDAEIAEVRRLGEDAFEITMSRVERARAAVNGAAAATPAPPAVAADGSGGAPADGADPSARSATLRFRRGSRAPLRPPEIPLVGMVDVEPAKAAPEPAPAVEPAAKGRKGTRGGRPAKRPESKAKEPAAPPPAPVAAAAVPDSAVAKPVRGIRSRGRRKGA